VLTAVPVLFAVWALAGLYGALGPALVHALTGSGDVVLGSLSLFVLAASAVVATIVLRRAAARTVMLVGIAALITGVAVTVLAVSLGSAAVFFAGSRSPAPGSAAASRAASGWWYRWPRRTSGPAWSPCSTWCPTSGWACPPCWPGSAWCTAEG
jgi:hypothetical protein